MRARAGVLALGLSLLAASVAAEPHPLATFKLKCIDNKRVKLDRFLVSVMLVVNVASE